MNKAPARLDQIRNENLKDETFIFLAGITSIDCHTLEGCANFTTINIPNSVRSIGDCTFYKWTALTSVYIPGGVISIGDFAFAICTALNHVHIPDSVISIGKYAFARCAALTSVHIPGSVIFIWEYVFAKCTALTSVHIPSSAIFIGEYAFAECTALIRVHIPGSVIFIDNSAFSGCTALTSIIINTKDKVEFKRITQLLPEELRSKAIPSPMYNAQHLMLSKFNARAYPIPSLPTEVISTIFSYDELTSELNFTLSTALQNVPIPTSWDDLTNYKRTLNDVLGRHQVCVYLNHYKETIKQSAPKHLRFFSGEGRTPNSQHNKAIVELYKLIDRLITGLSKPDAIQLSIEEKALLLTKPILMERIPLAIQQQMGMESQEHTQNAEEYALVDRVEPIFCCTIS